MSPHVATVRQRVQVDIPNARNETALAIACRKGDASMASFLLKASRLRSRILDSR